MNGKLLISLLAGLLLAGGAGTTALAQDPCQQVTYPDDETCRGDRDYPIVTINIASKYIKVRPLIVCAAPGARIEFRIVPRAKRETGFVLITPKEIVKTGPAEKLTTWLLGTNPLDVNKIEVGIPPVIEETDYEYSVRLADGRCIDPRVHVE